jgi:hypothetical protein
MSLVLYSCDAVRNIVTRCEEVDVRDGSEVGFVLGSGEVEWM